MYKVKSLSHVRHFATPWIVAYKAPPSMGFSRQEYWSGLQFSLSRASSQARDPTCILHRFVTTVSLGKPHILGFNFLLDIWFTNIFSFIWLSFHFADASLCSAKHLVWCHPTWSFFYSCLRRHWNILLRPMSKSILHTFSCMDFMVSYLTFKSFIHFGLIFMYGVR